MKPRIYVDTSVISYLTAKAGRDAVAVARQIITVQWWSDAPLAYELVVSDFVIEEARKGDAIAADRRLGMVSSLPSVNVDMPEIEGLANSLMDRHALPPSARFDALHIAASACNGIEFLVTWNDKHLANPLQLDFVEKICAQAGYRAPRIVTPDQLLQIVNGDDVE
jgi:predicted nucleic acid-binding protein